MRFVLRSPRPDGATVFIRNLEMFPISTTTDRACALTWPTEDAARRAADIGGIDTHTANGWQIARI